MPVADLPARASGLHVFTAWGNGFAQWWLSGLRNAVPARWREWAEGEARPQVTLWRDGDSVTCRLASAAGPAEIRIPFSHFNAAVLEQWLTGQGVSREATTVASMISREPFFLRELSVPKAAFAALPKILDQDILRRTPFQLSDIWHAATAVGQESDGVVPMCHWIKAFLITTQNPLGVWVQLNGQIDGWRVAAVIPEHVVLEGQGEKLTVPLHASGR